MSGLDRATLADMLANGARALQLDLSQRQSAQLLDYLALLAKWNAVYNLTAVRDPVQMMTQHLLDSLAAVSAFSAANVLDVGAGGGLPGIVLAIVRPDMQVSLIDTVRKKTAFLTQAKGELELGNVIVHTGRVEELQVPRKFDAITSRAFAELADFVNWAGHVLEEGGRFIALKGTVPHDEIARLPSAWKVVEVRRLQVPGLHAERHLIFIERGTA
ncbi:MAG TPA: 16S rRNA (guanine(527)-N(7))-methyltransferase RsmG [Burkholderiaceae bacterium]|jgi:16S rRNA (guanine527-N7)-methyltransferase|nr:16S rRNA (guanine(527)-N(7))-methyltransferase RsmG [Burkholderiaceae bacterium]